MNPLAHIATYPLAHALGWTLLHFCWQGAAVAALLWCVLGAFGPGSSRTRYAASCFALAFLALLPMLTFARLAVQDYRLAKLTHNAPIDVATLFVQADAAGPPTPWPLRLAVVLDHCVPWVLALWLAGVVLFLVRLNLGLLAARRMRSAGTVVSPDLQHLFRQLCAGLGIRRAVRLLHSASVQVPTVIGWLRPVVLLPVSCLTGLSPAQVEALLCHELAHVRRHDYLVSVIQSVVETLLFYHPAVWWVSKQVRRERECCCDELAVQNGGDVLAYARALSWLEEQRACTPQLVLGANGGVLAMRIRRLLGYPESSAASQFASIALLAAIALAGLAFLGRLAYAESAASQPAPAPATTAPGTPSPAAPVGGGARSGSNAAPQTQEEESGLRDSATRLRDAEDRLQKLQSLMDALARQRSDLVRQYGSPTNLKDEERAKFVDVQSQLDWASRGYDEVRNEYQSDLATLFAQASAAARQHSLQQRLQAAQAAMARVNTPEFSKQLEDARAVAARVNTPELRKQLDAAQSAMAKVNAADLERQLEAARAALTTINAPEFRQQFDDAMRSAQQLNTPEFKKQMEQLLAQRSLFAQESAPPVPAAAPVSESPQNVLTLPAGAVYGNIIHSVDPVYPPIAKAAHLQGVVVLDARISKEGMVEDVSPVSGPSMLQASAVDAVRQWTFKPYTVDGQPVAVHTTISVNFTFGGDSQNQKVFSPTTLDAQMAKMKAPHGTVVVQDPHTGQILALAISPRFNPNDSSHMQPGSLTPLTIGIGAGDGSRPVYPQTDGAGNPIRRIGGGVSAPAIIHQVNPEYTPEAKKAKFGGTVLVGCIVNEQGVPEDVHVVRGIGMGLNDKAVEAVKQYKFRPALENGVPVPTALNIEVNFQIF